jgi:hypothetical protein
MTPWPPPTQPLSRVDLLRADSLVVLARNVRTGTTGKHSHPRNAVDAIDQLVELAGLLRPAIEERAMADPEGEGLF